MLKYILLTTTTCNKCPSFKQELFQLKEENDILVLDETMDSFMEYVQKFNATSAPTLIICDENDDIKLQTSDILEVKNFFKNEV